MKIPSATTGFHRSGRALRLLSLAASFLLLGAISACGPSEAEILRDENEELRYALERANEAIEIAAGQIESAQAYLGGSYEDISYALSAIDIPERVEEP